MKNIKGSLKYMLLTFGMLFMVGCTEMPVDGDFITIDEVENTENNGSDVAKEVTEDINTKEDNVVNSDEYIELYLTVAESANKVIDSLSENFTTFNNSLVNNVNIANDATFRANVEEMQYYFALTYNQMLETTPPDKFSKHYKLITESLNNYSKSADAFVDSLDTLDAEKMTESANYIVDAIKLQNEAKDEMDSILNEK